MTSYLALVAAARTADASLGVFSAHERVRSTLAGRAAYAAYLSEKGISRRRDTNAARTEPDGAAVILASESERAAPSGGGAYLLAVAAARRADPSLSGIEAHKMTMRGRPDLYSADLRAKGIVRD